MNRNELETLAANFMVSMVRLLFWIVIIYAIALILE